MRTTSLLGATAVLLAVALSGADAWAARAQTRTVYLNKDGVTLVPGRNDSRMNRSSLIDAPVTIPRWEVADELWRDTVTCLKEVFVPFAIDFTETDPGNVLHVEAVFGGSPELLGRKSTSTGVSPFANGCGVIESSIVIAFTDVPRTARFMCEMMAHEIGHSYGLDHVLLASDVMSYLPYREERGFMREAATCGEHSPRPCGAEVGASCRQAQSSYELLAERIGLAGEGDTQRPVVAIATPSTGATVTGGFTVTANITDNVRVKLAWLLVDGVVVDMLAEPPWVFAAPEDLESGVHLVEVKATDGANEEIAALEVTVEGDDEAAGCAATRGTGWLMLLLVLGVPCARGPRGLRSRARAVTAGS